MLSALNLIGCVTILSVSVLCCRPKEYETRDGQCCPMCHEGTVVKKDCTTQSGTRCVQCDSGTYMDQPNGLTKCFSCASCHQGLFAQQNCTLTSNTVCGVLSGYFCRSLADKAGCSLAEKHTRCARGQRIKQPGTNITDTVCEGCQEGTFSQDGVNCTAWTVCTESQIKVKEGSAGSNVVCGSATRHHYTYIPFLIWLLTVAGFVITGRTGKKSAQHSTAQH